MENYLCRADKPIEFRYLRYIKSPFHISGFINWCASIESQHQPKCWYEYYTCRYSYLGDGRSVLLFPVPLTWTRVSTSWSPFTFIALISPTLGA
jgi:hypothetical protein